MGDNIEGHRQTGYFLRREKNNKHYLRLRGVLTGRIKQERRVRGAGLCEGCNFPPDWEGLREGDPWGSSCGVKSEPAWLYSETIMEANVNTDGD